MTRKSEELLSLCKTHPEWAARLIYVLEEENKVLRYLANLENYGGVAVWKHLLPHLLTNTLSWFKKDNKETKNHETTYP